MKYNFLYLCLFLLSLNGCATKGNTPVSTSDQAQHSGTGTLVINPIVFNKNAYIRDAVKRECKLKEKLAQFIEQNATTQYAQIHTDSNAVRSGAQVLSLQIEQVQGSAGGAWSGGKMVLVKGKLTQRGKVLGDFKGRRYSGGGMFGGYKGTCAILGRCVKALGRDIAEWLRHPTSKAILGDL